MAIDLPKRRETTPTRGAAVRITDVRPSPESRELIRLGNTLSALGSDFESIVRKSMENAISEDTAKARVSLLSETRLYHTKLATSLPQNMPRHLWGDLATAEFDRISNSILQNMSTDGGKKKFQEDLAKERVRIATRAAIAGMTLGHQEMKAGLPGKMVNFVEAGRLNEYFNLIDKILPLDQALVKKEQATKYHVAFTARNLFDSEGVAAAIAYVKDQDEILDSKERGILVGELTLTAKKLNVQAESQSQLAIIETVDNYYNSISKGQFIDSEQLINDEERLGLAEWQIWNEINKGQGSQTVTKTNPKELLKLYEMLFSAWKNEPRAESDNILIKTRIAEAYHVDKSISNQDFNSLNRLMTSDVKPTYIQVLASGFDRVESVINKEGWFGDRVKLTKAEAQAIVESQAALTQWVLDETSRKKDVSVESVQNQAEKYAIIFNSSAVRKQLKKQPKNEADFEAKVKELSKQRTTLGMAYYNRWVDKFGGSK